MYDVQVLIDKLIQFKTAKEIANFLEEQGIQGTRKNPFVCPLAQYFTSLTGYEASFGFSGGRVYLQRPKQDYIIKCTNAMTSFIFGFDGNKYPNLVKED